MGCTGRRAMRSRHSSGQARVPSPVGRIPGSRRVETLGRGSGRSPELGSKAGSAEGLGLSVSITIQMIGLPPVTATVAPETQLAASEASIT